MADRTDNIRPYFLDLEAHHAMGTSLTSSSPRSFGKSLELSVFWVVGGDSMTAPVRVSILGTQDDAFYCPRDIFTRSATRLGGEPIFSPPPFAAPCSDGILIIYTLCTAACPGETVDVRGGYILVPKEILEAQHVEASISVSWGKAQKPTTMAVMLERMGFGERSYNQLN